MKDGYGFQALIEALTILAKHANHDLTHPTSCEHDVLYVFGAPPDEMDGAEVARLDELGFGWDASVESWFSFRFGSA